MLRKLTPAEWLDFHRGRPWGKNVLGYPKDSRLYLGYWQIFLRTLGKMALKSTKNYDYDYWKKMFCFDSVSGILITRPCEVPRTASVLWSSTCWMWWGCSWAACSSSSHFSSFSLDVSAGPVEGPSRKKSNIDSCHKVSLDVSEGPAEVPSRKKNNINSCHKVLLDVSAGPAEGPSRKKNNINSCHKVSLDVSAWPAEGPSRKKNNINSCHKVSLDVSPQREE